MSNDTRTQADGGFPRATCITKLAGLFRARGLTRVQVIAATGIPDRQLRKYCNQPEYPINNRNKALLADLLDVDPDEFDMGLGPTADAGVIHGIIIPIGFVIGGLCALLADVTITNSLLTLIVAIIPVMGAVIISRRATSKELASIEVKVDGRLEQALERIDALEADKSEATGEPAPPKVSGLNVPAGRTVKDIAAADIKIESANVKIEKEKPS